MNIPNIISLSRILLTPVFALLYVNGRSTQALAVLLICAASDVLDGAIARRFNMVTDLGKALDPAADKLIQLTMLLCAATRFRAVWLLLALHILRELSLGAAGLYVLRQAGRVYGARWYGKLCTAVLYIVMTVFLFLRSVPDSAVRAGTAMCAFLISLCLSLYMANYIRILRLCREHEAEKDPRSV